LIEVTREWLEVRREMPAREIAAELGCGDAWVYRLFQKHGVQRACRVQEKRPSKYDWVTAEWLEARKHLEVPEIAEEIGCSESQVYFLFERRGVQRVLGNARFDWVTREWLEAHAHLTNGQLAAEIGCTYKYVSELLKRHGLLRRRRKRSETEVHRSCPCGPCAAECMARALADEAVWCEVG